MCGIAGVTWDDGRLVASMIEAIEHRGPDGTEIMATGAATLGQARLAIVDVRHGDGMMTNESGMLQLAFNGEIYNHQALRSELSLKGHGFRCLNDAEVVVHGFEEWGLGVLDRLDGMYAFALLDRARDTLVLARDPFGIKNLYTREYPSGLAFASEIKPLLGLGPTSCHEAALEDIGTYGYIPGPHTPFLGVRSLEPGTALVLSSGRMVERQSFGSLRRRKVRSTPATLLGLIDASVRNVTTGEVPIAILLSGGVDSSILAALAARYNPVVKAFTVGFAGEDTEFEFSRDVAEHLGLAYEEVVIRPEDVDADLAAIVRHQEIPQDRGSMVPKWFLAKTISAQGFRVVLGGSGADEIFGGYSRYDYRYDQEVTHGKRGRAVDEDYFVTQLQRATTVGSLFGEYAASGTWLDAPSFFDTRYELPYYHNPRLDKTFMAHGLEYRVPFQQRAIAEYVLSLPLATRMRDGVRKAILRDAAALVLPERVAQREKRPLKAPPIVHDPDAWAARILATWREVFRDDLRGEVGVAAAGSDQRSYDHASPPWRAATRREEGR